MEFIRHIDVETGCRHHLALHYIFEHLLKLQITPAVKVSWTQELSVGLEILAELSVSFLAAAAIPRDLVHVLHIVE